MKRVAALLILASIAACTAEPSTRGTRVVALTPDGSAKAGGVEVDDILLALELPDGSEIEVDDYAALSIAWARAADRPLRVEVERRGVALSLELPAGQVGLESEPPYVAEEPQDEEQASAACWRAIAALDLEAAVEVDPACAALGVEHRWWWWREVVRSAFEARKTELADRAAGELQQLSTQHAAFDPVVRAAAELIAAEFAFMLNDYERAEIHIAAGREAIERFAPDSPSVARLLLVHGKIERNRGDLAAAEHRFSEALDRGRAIGCSARTEGDLLNELGIVADRRGDLELAESRYRQALEVYPVSVRRSLRGGVIRMGMGIVAWNRGHLEAAEAEFDAANTIFLQHAPDTPYEGWSLQNLGLVAQDRGDLAAAEDYYRRSLALRERVTPDGIDVAMALNNLGALLLDTGELGEADASFARAAEIVAEFARDSQLEASIAGHRGQVAAARGEYESALAFYERTHAIAASSAPGSLFEAGALIAQGRLERDRGRLDQGRRRVEGALAIRERLAPGTAAVAEAYHALGTIERSSGDSAAALDAFEAAVAALDAQRGRVGGGEAAPGRFSARYAEIYEDYTDLLLEVGREREAFEVQERFRVRGLLAMMAERDVRLDRDLPPALAQRRRDLDRRYERAQGELAALDASARDRIEALIEELRQLRRDRQRLDVELRAADPRRADFRRPERIEFETVVAMLGGRRLIAFDVGASRTIRFEIDPQGRLEVTRLPLGREVLAERVERFRELIRLGDDDEVAAEASLRRASALYESLMPVSEGEESWLILRDGPLYRLPFAALRDDEGFLIEARPIHFVSSATLYRALGALGGAQAESLIAFGDPRLTSDATSRLRGAELGPLPHARAEAKGIAQGFPGSRVLLGREASEHNAKRLLADRAYVHFATHAQVDERFPLDSYLLLGDDEGENGQLQGWEILSEIRLDAELVTLSTCDSALGAELGGEGIVGLTWAFQYAGARSIAASLWPVADRSTEQLMEALYERLRQGLPRDEALRQAQRSLIGTMSPYRWAAFQLEGRPD